QFHQAATVVLLVDIDSAGAVARARVETPAGHGFDEAALAAAQKLKFFPATQGGRPIPSRIHFRYTFSPPPARLAGRVASRVTDAPLKGAEVVVKGADGVETRTVTDDDGNWSMTGLPFGKVHVRVTAKGRVAEESDESLSPGQETRVVLRLANEEVAAPPPVPGGGPAALEVEVKG